MQTGLRRELTREERIVFLRLLDKISNEVSFLADEQYEIPRAEYIAKMDTLFHRKRIVMAKLANSGKVSHVVPVRRKLR